MAVEGNRPKVDGDVLYDGDFNVLPRYVDNTGESITTANGETTVWTSTIPANTVGTAIIILGSLYYQSFGNDENGIFNLYIGTAGSEVLKQTFGVNGHNVGSGDTNCTGSLVWYESGQTWTGEVSVLVKADQSTAQNKEIGLLGGVILGY
jgi:hypothetical protein